VSEIFARKVSHRAKWADAQGLGVGEISSDAVTRDLPTLNNELSFWSCASTDDDELQETVLAMAANGDRLDKMDVVWLESTAVNVAAVTVQPSPHNANTPVESIKSRHVDFARLDLVRLGKVAILMRDAVVGDCCKRFQKADVLKVLVKAVREGRLKLEQLKDDLRSKVEAALPNTTP
jgi:hypothetical protein